MWGQLVSRTRSPRDRKRRHLRQLRLEQLLALPYWGKGGRQAMECAAYRWARRQSPRWPQLPRDLPGRLERML